MSRAVKPTIREDVRQLSGAERSAVLLLALGEEHSARLWQMMDEEEVKEVSQIMSNLGSVSSGVVEKLLVEFVSQMSGTGSLMGSYESTERLIARFMAPEKVAQVMEEIRGPAGRTMWDKLANVN
jgi:flagellar motor switch protein FliG